MAYLIDTDIIIFALRKDKSVLIKFEENKNIPISISMITYAELIFGAKRSQNEQQNMIKVRHIRELYPIEDLNEGVMEVFADIKAKMFNNGIRIEDMDLLIAATAIYNDLTLVTNNVKHFEKIPYLKLENWKSWET
jgi:vapC-like nucleic acid-binding protein